MLRFLYTVCDLLGAICAIVSPVAILHWLMKVVNSPALAAVTTALDPVFIPLNAFVEFFVKAPNLSFQGHEISTTQGVLACIMTFGFFLMNFCSEALKATEQRMDVNQQARQQRQRLQQATAQERKQLQQSATNRRLLVHILYDFHTCPAGGASFETEYKRFGGKPLESLPDAMTLEFESLERAFRYCLDASQNILSHYATLRPMDPQPTFHVGIHAFPMELPKSDCMERSRKLAGHADQNQIVFSKDVLSMMEAKGLANDYQFHSLGMYAMENNRNQEVFRLFYQKRNDSF